MATEKVTCLTHRWRWRGMKQASGRPTRDVYRCEICGATKEVSR